MNHRPKSQKHRKRRNKGRGKLPGTRCDVSGVADVRSSKNSCGRLKRPPSSPIPSTSAHVGTTRPQSRQSNVSTRVGSPIPRPAKEHKGNGYNSSPGWRPVHKRGRNRGSARGSTWTKQKRHSTPSPQPQRPSVQNQTGQDQGRPAQDTQSQRSSISELDITSCQWLYHGAYIGNETRSIEFKRGGECYMQTTFCRHICKYGCAFLNSGGGSLLVGVSDDGVVCGVHFGHEKEDDTRLQVDLVVKLFHPPLLPHNYSLHFLPVIKPGEDGHRLRVLRLTFRPPPAFTEPTLFQIDGGDVYVRRDGSVQGPLGASVILEWSRQMWIGKVQQLEQHVREATSEKWFLVGQVHGLRQSISPLHRIMASLLPQKRTAPTSEQERKEAEAQEEQNSRASSSTPSVGTPDSEASSQL